MGAADARDAGHPGEHAARVLAGGAYVDWVGTDFYSRFPNFHWLDDFYRDFGGKPFVFGEWALWGGDDPAFVARLFGWIGSHPRVRMVVYNQGALTDGPFRLNRYPRSAPRCARRSRTAASRTRQGRPPVPWRFAVATPDLRFPSARGRPARPAIPTPLPRS